MNLPEESQRRGPPSGCFCHFCDKTDNPICREPFSSAFFRIRGKERLYTLRPQTNYIYNLRSGEFFSLISLSRSFRYDKLEDSAKVVLGGGQGGNIFDRFARDRGDCVNSSSAPSIRQKRRSFRHHCRRSGTAFR